MSALTEVGEIGVYTQDAEYILRPTLRAMAALGEPQEIVELFVSVMGPEHTAQRRDALLVLWACASDFEPSEVFGYVDQEGGRLALRTALVPQEHFVPLARELLKHGIVGDVKARNAGDESNGTEKFVARDYAMLGVSHLGLSEQAAWDMTMTSLVTAMRNKFPDATAKAGDGAPSKEQHERTMEWFEDIQRSRKKRKKAGVH